jgi:hypothetical protein
MRRKVTAFEKKADRFCEVLLNEHEMDNLDWSAIM